MAYQSEKEIFEIVRGFENGTIKREDWRHAEHLTVACFYAFHHDFDAALARMRDGIFNLLNAFKIDLSKDMLYHETLTVFWMRTIFDFCKPKNACSIVELCNETVERFDKDYPLRFYSRELLFSEKARTIFIEPEMLRM